MKTKRRLLSWLLCGAMLFSLCPQSVMAEGSAQDSGQTVEAGGLCEHHTEHDGSCGYTEGTPGTPCGHKHTEACYTEVTECVHEHTAECYPEEAESSVSGNDATPSDAEQREPENCPHICDEDSGCVTEELNCTHEHDSECGYVPATEGTPCGYVCEICNAEDNGETATPSNAQNSLTQLITAWEWIDEWEALSYDDGAAAWVLALPGASESNPAMREDIVSLLPESIIATLGEEQETISLDDWTCEDYPESGAGSGSYTFTAALPEGYALDSDVSALAVTVELGGAALYATTSNIKYLDENGDEQTTTGEVTIIDDTMTTWEAGWYVVNGNITIGTEADTQRVTVSGDVHLILADGCTLTVNGGIEVSSSNSLTIYAQSDSDNMGALTAQNATYHHASIGGDGTGSITINGGMITAKGASHSAGIGGNWYCSGGTITINGGIVDATGGTCSAGIGGAYYASGGAITINGGTITATGSVGIGGGRWGNAGTITINGGTIEATGTEGTGIGNGDGGSSQVKGGSVTINGGTIIADGESENGASQRYDIGVIGNKWLGAPAANVTINGGNIETKSNGIKAPVNSSGERVYLGKFENAQDVTDVFVDRQSYYIDGNDGTLWLYMTGEDHTITFHKTNGEIVSYAVTWDGDTSAFSFSIALNASTNLEWDSTTSGKATWNAVDNASGYSVQLYKDGSAEGNPVSTTETSYTFTIAAAGSYTFKVKATDSSGTYADSAEAESTVLNYYTVTFDTDGGNPVDDQVVVNGGKVTEPTDPTKTGYTFMGWYSNKSFEESYQWNFSNNTVSEAMTLYAKWDLNSTPITPGDTVRYIVEHYKADKDSDTGYTLADTEHFAGKISDTVTATPKTYDGYTYNAEKSTASGQLKKISSADDIVTLKLYYDVTSTPITPGDTVRYIVEHYKADASSGTGYTLADTEYFAGKISNTVTATPKTYDGYTYNAEKSTASGQLKKISGADDIVTLKLYYDVTSTPITPGDTVGYIVEHYKADKDSDTGYTLADTEHFAGKISDTVTATPKTYDGYTYNAEKSTASGQLKKISGADDIVTLKLYYDVTSTPITPGDTVRYIVEHYKASGDGYTLADTEYLGGTIGATVTAQQKTYTGYTYNPDAAGTVASGKLTEIKSAADIVTLKLYYDLTVYTVTVQNDGNGAASASSTSATMGTEITLTATANSGYQFKEWQVVSGDVTISGGKFTMPAENVTVKAIFERQKDDSGGGSSSGGDSGSDDGGGTSGGDTDTGSPFTDVKKTDWFYDDVMFVYENGLMAGTSATTFEPNSNTTRAQIAVIFYRLEGSPEVTGESTFTDVKQEPGTDWYYNAVIWAQQSGIMGGYGDGTFGPNDPVTREQLASIFYRYAQYKGYDVSTLGSLDSFTDKDSVSAWAQEAMKWAVGNGIINGRENNLLAPKGTATRAEIAAMLHRFIEKYKLVPAASTTGSSGTGSGTSGWVQRTGSPLTGDGSNMGLWLFTLCTSAGALAALLIFKRREEEERGMIA